MSNASSPPPESTSLKIFIPQQMLQELPIAFGQVKSGNALISLLNEIRQIIYSLCRVEENTKKVYSNITNSLI